MAVAIFRKMLKDVTAKRCKYIKGWEWNLKMTNMSLIGSIFNTNLNFGLIEKWISRYYYK